MAEIVGSSQSRLDGARECSVIHLNSDHPGDRVLPDPDPNWINQESNGMGSPAPASTKRVLLLAIIPGTPTRSTTLREDVLVDVETNSRPRTLAVHAREQKVLAGADRDHTCSRRLVINRCQELRDRSVHLHSLLTRVVTALRW